MTDFFRFEEKIDLPFYNGTPELSKLGWAGLVLAICLYIIIIRNQDIIVMDSITYGVVTALIFLIPLTYATKGKLSLFFRRIRRQDIKLIILFTIASLIFSEILVITLELLSINTGPIMQNFQEDLIFNISNAAGLVIALIAEELYKVFMLIIFTAILYRLTKNRKTSLSIAILITMIIFGAGHEGGEMGTLLKVIIVQGFGSIFDILLYLKTKNVFVSYTSHLLFDWIPDVIGLIRYMVA